MTKARVLIVDDDPTNRMKMRMAVKALDLDADAVANGREALKFLDSGAFDLVLLDLMMPEMDGYQVLEAIRSDTEFRGIPVVVISAVDEVESVVRAIKLGAEDYLPKTFDPTLFEARVTACLEKKRLRDVEMDYVRRIEDEKSRADAILHATLPAAAVHELKATNCVRPRRFENVAVLFSDVTNFTTYCDTQSPEDVVSHLQELVASFEEIAERYGLEKIKTVGDAFLATAGLFRYIPDPVVAATRCGLEMTAAAPRLAVGWQVHVGIHAGSLVAGVIGQRQYLFDIWGDTVNTAARIADRAMPGKVLVSSTAWRQVGKKMLGSSMGILELKGKGGVELIECRGARPD
jgi:adenylate cyclase